VLAEATWEEAFSLVAEKLSQYKGSQFAAVASARSTNETAYLLQKFTRAVMQSNSVDVDSNTRPALAGALESSLGYAATTNPIWELERAGCILAVETNLTEEHNVVGVPIKQATKSSTRLIVIDSREVELTRYAHLWLRPRPGTTLALLGGVLRVVLDEGQADDAFLQEQCDGLDELRASLEAFSLDHVSRLTGVAEDDIRTAAAAYAGAETSAIVYALDNVDREDQASQVHALADLALATGNIGKPSSGLYALRHGANEQGASDVGCVPDLMPGYERLDDPAARQRLEQRWGSALPADAGLGIGSVFEAARDGGVKAMLLLGESANYDDVEMGDATEALEHLEFLVVQDAFLGAAAQRAHVVLPAATFIEEDGTYTNLERRVQLLSKGLSPANIQARPGWQTLCQIAQAMDANGFEFDTAAQVFDEVASVATIYGGISHQRLRKEAVLTLRPDPLNPLPTQILQSDRVSQGIQWPCPDAGAPGTQVLYAKGFPGGRARLMALTPPSAMLQPSGEFPFLLAPGRVLAQNARDGAVVRADGVDRIQREELVEVNPVDAADLGIGNGDTVEVILSLERIRGVASISDSVQSGVLSMTFLFGELATRLQASEDPDPMSHVPGLMVYHARLEKVTG
jgi:predicted molibdopterin-dependent oxidoreductase YjgC